MKQKPIFNILIPLIVILATAAALVGLLVQGGDGPTSFTTLHGQTAHIYGKGLYRFDTILFAMTFKGTDVVTLVFSVPLLIIAFILYRRNLLRGGLLLLSAIPYFIYIGASMAFSAAFNSAFLLYVALLSASLFTFLAVISAIDSAALARHVRPGFPHRVLAIFLFVAGLGTLFLWLSELVGTILTGSVPPNLGPYTTPFTHGFDSAIITPALLITGVFLLQRKPPGVPDARAGGRRQAGAARLHPGDDGREHLQEPAGAASTVGFPTVVITNKDMAEPVAYAVTKTIVENKDALVRGHAGLADFDPTQAWRPERVGIPLHPGAEKLYREKGWMTVAPPTRDA